MLGADWQPVVDPTGAWVVAWEGTVRAGAEGLSMVPATGRLVIHPFQDHLPDPAASPPRSTSRARCRPTSRVAADGPAERRAALPDRRFAGSQRDGTDRAGGRRRGPDRGVRCPLGRHRDVAGDLDRRCGRPIHRAAQPAARRPVTGLVDRPLGAPQDVPALPGLLDRRRAPGLGDAAGPGWRGQPDPDRGLDRRMRLARWRASRSKEPSSSSSAGWPGRRIEASRAACSTPGSAACGIVAAHAEPVCAMSPCSRAANGRIV